MLVDAHTHIYPRAYIERLMAEEGPPRVIARDGKQLLDIFPNSGGSGQPMTDEFHSVQAKLAFMDRHGIAASVLSIGNPWVDFMPADEATDWAARLNTTLEAVCAAHPGRLAGLGVLPVQHPAAAVAELERIALSGALRGAVVSAKPAGGRIDSPGLEPVWAKAAELGLPLVIHPHFTVGEADLEGHGVILNLVCGFTFETTIAAIRLILSGVLDRHPALKLLLVHAGGTLPYLAGRLDQFSRFAGLPRKPSEYLSRFYYDAVTYHGPALRCALETAGGDRFLFGTDHPFGAPDPGAWGAMVSGLGLGAGAEAAIRSGTAGALFGLAAPEGVGA